MPTRSIPWPRIFAEGVAIVVSILLAFGIQAWWEGRQERVEEQRILAALQRDFDETRADLLVTMGQFEQVEDSIMLLIALISDPQRGASPTRLDNLIQASFRTYFPETRLSTYQEVVSSGNLRLIESDSLRVSMAVLLENLDQVHSWTDLLLQRWPMVEEPILIGQVVMPQVYEGYRDRVFPPVPFVTDYTQLGNSEFVNLLGARVIYLSQILANAQVLLDDIDTVLRLIRQEIAP